MNDAEFDRELEEIKKMLGEDAESENIDKPVVKNPTNEEPVQEVDSHDDADTDEDDDDQERELTEEEKNISKRFAAWLLAILTLLLILYIIKESKKETKEPSREPTSSMSDDKDPDYVLETTSIEDDIVYGISESDFEDLVANYVKTNDGRYPGVSTNDILKFVALTNIDEIYENSPDLAKNLFDANSSEEYFNDAFKVIGATVMYDFNVWNQTNSTEGFIKVSDIVIGSQKEQMIKIENYVNRVADAVNAEDEVLVNSVVSEFIMDMNCGELSKLDDGVGFSAQIYIALIADGIAKDYLNQQNFDMLQVLKESNKYISNMFAVYDKCNSNAKTLRP